jgi:hypothetical protein
MQSGRGVFIGPVLAAERHFQMSDDVKTRIAQLSRFRRWQHMTNTRAFGSARRVSLGDARRDTIQRIR